MDQVLLRRRAAAEAASISLPTLDKLIRSGRIKTIRVGRAILIPRSSLLKFAKADHSIEPHAQSAPSVK